MIDSMAVDEEEVVREAVVHIVAVEVPVEDPDIIEALQVEEAVEVLIVIVARVAEEEVEEVFVAVVISDVVEIWEAVAVLVDEIKHQTFN